MLNQTRYSPRHKWTDAEVRRLRKLYPDLPAKKVAEQMALRVSQVYQMAARLGLKKSEEFKQSDMSGRIARGKQDPRMIASRFQPGLVPWNKGAHYVAGGRSAETRFKSGRKPEESANYQPIGTLRLSKDGYLEQKVSDDQSIVPARRWNFVHRLVWERSNGPIPTGFMVVFKPGQFTNNVELLTDDRLECISRADNARRNSMWAKNPELMKLYQLKGAIQRQVNRIKESSHV